MRRRAAAVILFLLVSLPAGAAMLGAAPFSRMDPGARSAALGGAVGALETGPAATFVNPAGLARLEDPLAVTADSGLLPFNQSLNFVGFAGWPMAEMCMGLGALFYGAGDDIEFRKTNTPDADSLESALSQEYVLAVGAKIFPPVNAGFSFKMLMDSIAEFNAAGYSSDIGFTYTPWRPLTASFLLRDYIGPTMTWTHTHRENETTQDMAASMRLGCAADFGGFRTSVEGRDLGGPYWRMGGGAEWDLHRMFTLRGGFDGTRAACGFGARWSYRDKVSLSLDYAFAPAPPNDYQNRFTLSAGIGAIQLERGKMLFPVQMEQ